MFSACHHRDRQNQILSNQLSAIGEKMNTQIIFLCLLAVVASSCKDKSRTEEGKLPYATIYNVVTTMES